MGEGITGLERLAAQTLLCLTYFNQPVDLFWKMSLTNNRRIETSGVQQDGLLWFCSTNNNTLNPGGVKTSGCGVCEVPVAGRVLFPSSLVMLSIHGHHVHQCSRPCCHGDLRRCGESQSPAVVTGFVMHACCQPTATTYILLMALHGHYENLVAILWKEQVRALPQYGRLARKWIYTTWSF